jgi:hypothetical protein
MQKTSLVVLLLAGLVTVIIFSVYLVLKEFQEKAEMSALSPYSYIPEDATMIYQLNDLIKVSKLRPANPSLLQERISGIFSPNNFSDILNFIDSFIGESDGNTNIPEKITVLISLHLQEEKSEGNYLFVISLSPGRKSEKQIAELIKNLSRDEFISKTEIDNSNIFKFNSDKESLAFFVVPVRNSVLISQNYSLLERSLDAAGEQKSTNNLQAFKDLIGFTNDHQDNLFIETGSFSDFTLDYFFWDHPLSIDYSIFSGWQLLKPDLTDSLLRFEGLFISPPDGFFSSLNFQKPGKSDVWQMIPEDPALLLQIQMPDTELFRQDMTFILKQNKKYSLHELNRRRFNDITALHPDSIKEFWTGELAMVLPGKEPTQNESPVIVLGIRNFESILNHPRLGVFFRKLDSESNNKTNRDMLFEVTVPGFFPALTHGLIKDDIKWLIPKGEYLLASAHKEDLVNYREYLADSTLFSFTEFNDNHTENELREQNVFFYFSLPLLLENYEIMFTDRFLDMLEENETYEVLMEFHPVIFGFKQQDEMARNIITHSFIKHNEKRVSSDSINN